MDMRVYAKYAFDFTRTEHSMVCHTCITLEPKWLRMMRIDDDRLAPPHRHHPFITATTLLFSDLQTYLKSSLLRTLLSTNNK